VTHRGVKTALIEPTTVKVANLTGPGTSAAPFGVGGTDLGIAVALADGRTGFIFGDSFDECRGGGPGWRSPVMLRSHHTSPRHLNEGIRFDDAVGGSYARQLWVYTHDAPPWRIRIQFGNHSDQGAGASHRRHGHREVHNCPAQHGVGIEAVQPARRLYGRNAQPAVRRLHRAGSTLRSLHLVVSHWNTTDGSNWPYRARQYRYNAALRL
jgi:hypothetical protein